MDECTDKRMDSNFSFTRVKLESGRLRTGACKETPGSRHGKEPGVSVLVWLCLAEGLWAIHLNLPGPQFPHLGRGAIIVSISRVPVRLRPDHPGKEHRREPGTHRANPCVR